MNLLWTRGDGDGQKRSNHCAVEREPEQRSVYLTEVCAGDEELRRLLDGLLAQSGASNGLVAQPIWEVVAGSAEPLGQIPAGTKLGPYEILGSLGEGGMGKVYPALDTRLDRGVAIKVSREQFTARFKREARAISALNYPNIGTLYDVGPNYLVMELVEGETLGQQIEHLGPLPLKEALDVALQVADALEAAHGKGIIHRDLKPANVKITPEGQVKVLDFGLAAICKAYEIRERLGVHACLEEAFPVGPPRTWRQACERLRKEREEAEAKYRQLTASRRGRSEWRRHRACPSGRPGSFGRRSAPGCAAGDSVDCMPL